ncbi:MAG TPA: M20/M25/M40 family metallo-hydrolase [Chitinophagaceae bacterium]|nr:M20/M25/M40 family metallo-hydrolase [Chitinophagaceae bacterium]
MRLFISLLFTTLFSASVIAQSGVMIEKPTIDIEVVNKIIAEGMNNSKVMQHAFYLTDVSGPRLTNSPGYQRAAEWAIKELKKWGVENAHLESWGEFGKSWNLDKSYIAMTAPYYKPLIAYPKTWTKGTNGLQHAELMVINAADSGRLESMAASMKGKIIVMGTEEVYKQSFKADASRYTDEDLAKMAGFVPPPVDTAAQRRQREGFARRMGNMGLAARVRTLAEKSGAVAMLSMSRGHDGTLFVQGPSARGAQNKDSADAFTEIMVSMEDYMTFCRLAKAGIPVKLDVDVKTTISKQVVESYNVIAEIPGTDPKLKDEVVMLGAHLDSWQSATGATDNAAGSAVMLEVMRIIKQLGLKPKRTVRLALWSGEEQGLLGSAGYVKKTFGEVDKPTPAHEKFQCYFNIDNGTGKVRGIYAQGNAGASKVFSEWLAPFKEMGASTVTLQNTGGTDHGSFQRVGLPGFQFIQDPIEYDTRTHHTNMDSYDHLIADDMKQISTIVASFVYNAAMMDEKFPRK